MVSPAHKAVVNYRLSLLENTLTAISSSNVLEIQKFYSHCRMMSDALDLDSNIIHNSDFINQSVTFKNFPWCNKHINVYLDRGNLLLPLLITQKLSCS